MTQPPCRSLGGKRWAVPAIIRATRAGFKTYLEPFLGAGALFFGLEEAGLLAGVRCILADSNPAGIDLFQAIKTAPDALTAAVNARVQQVRDTAAGGPADACDSTLAEAADLHVTRLHAAAEAAYYAERTAWNAGSRPAWRQLYLRRESFNGLWREASTGAKAGTMNAPWRKEPPRLLEPARLADVAGALRRTNAELVCGDFRAFDVHTPTTLCFCDPPYLQSPSFDEAGRPVGGFKAYTKDGWSLQDLTDLLDRAALWSSRGAQVVLTHADTPEFRALLGARWPLFDLTQVHARRAINSNGAGRGPVPELICTGRYVGRADVVRTGAEVGAATARLPAARFARPEAAALRARLAGRAVVASVSGGKDSAAMCLYLQELEVEHRRVFMDTGWEHPATYEYLRGPLQAALGPIEEIRGDLLMEDLVRKKGMFPSRLRRFCTEELKVFPIKRYLAVLDDPVNTVGIRAAESAARSELPEWDRSLGLDCDVWRPILRWTLEDVQAIHRRHGLEPNPLYLKGATRVGCWPCIFARKAEVRLIADIDPARIDRLRVLEQEVTAAARARYVATNDTRDPTRTWFHGRTSIEHANIDAAVAWARSPDRPGTQALHETGPEEGCVRWGLCDLPAPDADPAPTTDPARAAADPARAAALDTSPVEAAR